MWYTKHRLLRKDFFKLMFKRLTAAILLVLACAARGDQDNVLLWWFDDPEIAEVGGGAPIRAGNLVGRGGDAQGKTVNALRISVTDNEGHKVYLNLASQSMADTARNTWKSWMALPDVGGNFYAGPGYADLAGFKLSETGLMFAIELGNYTQTDDGFNWIVLAGSAGSTLQDLISGGHIIASELTYQGTSDWEAAGYSVPEPSSGLLVLIGGALLALRRRRKDVAA